MLTLENQDDGRKQFEILKEKGAFTEEMQYIHKSGEKRWWSIDGVKISEILYLGFTKDITTRKIAQEKIVEEKERLSVTLRSIGDGVITTDINGNVMIMNRIADVFFIFAVLLILLIFGFVEDEHMTQ